MTKQRLTFLCWNSECQHTYTLLREPVKGQKLFVQCPYCMQAGIVDLRRYNTRVFTVLKKFNDGQPQESEELALPNVLPTEKPPAESQE